jgi:large subunit ribosomal protein L6
MSQTVQPVKKDGLSGAVCRVLELQGVGYTMQLEGEKTLLFQLGRSHVDRFILPDGISASVERSRLTLTSTLPLTEKKRAVCLVHTCADQIRRLKRPDPYKGKGLRYEGEVLSLKKGKRR